MLARAQGAEQGHKLTSARDEPGMDSVNRGSRLLNCGCWILLISQRDHRVDPHCPTSGYVACQKRYGSENCWHNDEGQRVGRLNSKQQTGDQASNSQRPCQTHGYAENGHYHAVPHDQLQYVATPGTQRDPDSDLVCSLCDEERDYTVEPHRGQQDSEARKQSQDRGVESRPLRKITLARDVEAVLLESVTSDESGYKSVKHGPIPLLIEALKEEDKTSKEQAQTIARQQSDLQRLTVATEAAQQQLNELHEVKQKLGRLEAVVNRLMASGLSGDHDEPTGAVQGPVADHSLGSE